MGSFNGTPSNEGPTGAPWRVSPRGAVRSARPPVCRAARRPTSHPGTSMSGSGNGSSPNNRREHLVFPLGLVGAPSLEQASLRGSGTGDSSAAAAQDEGEADRKHGTE